jgi:hypothetical protein
LWISVHDFVLILSFPYFRDNDASECPSLGVAYREHHGIIMRRISMARAGIIEK